MRLLAADIGGTKTLLALADADAGSVNIVRQHRYTNSDFDSFDAELEAFLAPDIRNGGAIDAMCCAVAGPLAADGRSAYLTNLEWVIDADRIGRRLGNTRTSLINDFVAVGLGIDCLAEDEFVIVQSGLPRPGAPRVVLGAGTGLGVGWQVHDGKRYMVFPSEGGHMDFAPIGALQRELLAWLELRHHGHVSVERLVSGPGLVDLFRFLCERDPAQAADQLADALADPDPAAWISLRAGEQSGGIADLALDLFVSVYGAVAGNLALITLPYGGLYLAGGITPKIIDRVRGGRFLTAFNDKGRMSALTTTIPVKVVTNPLVGLHGALRAAHESTAVRRPENRS